jgi:uncharacterized RDD family membrane protein YckC
MKCPKCGYLGFETTDRCRNCQYDFSLAPFLRETDLTLREAAGTDGGADFDLPDIKRQTDTLSAGALDLDRLFGDQEPASAPPAPPHAEPTPPRDLESAPFEAPLMSRRVATEAPGAATAEPDAGLSATDLSALPFDESPLVPPRAARMPLAVRRATPEMPRNRPRTTRPIRMETPLAFDPVREQVPPDPQSGALASETVASLMRVPALGARVGAGAIDLALLAGIDAVVLFLTLRIAGLETSLQDLRVIPIIPFVSFLGLLGFGYVASFTVAGGQTIGKMLLGLRVIGDDGRPIDAAGGMLRAAGCMLVPATLGLSYVPALFSSDHRALHDRLAGTRVVSE